MSDGFRVVCVPPDGGEGGDQPEEAHLPGSEAVLPERRRPQVADGPVVPDGHPVDGVDQVRRGGHEGEQVVHLAAAALRVLQSIDPEERQIWQITRRMLTLHDRVSCVAYHRF